MRTFSAQCHFACHFERKGIWKSASHTVLFVLNISCVFSFDKGEVNGSFCFAGFFIPLHHLDVFMFDGRHPHGMALDNLSPGATRVSTASFLKKKMVIETKDFDELRKQSVFSTSKRKDHEKERFFFRTSI